MQHTYYRYTILLGGGEVVVVMVVVVVVVVTFVTIPFHVVWCV